MRFEKFARAAKILNDSSTTDTKFGKRVRHWPLGVLRVFVVEGYLFFVARLELREKPAVFQLFQK
jgi:hypothetical protein